MQLLITTWPTADTDVLDLDLLISIQCLQERTASRSIDALIATVNSLEKGPPEFRKRVWLSPPAVVQ